MKPEQKVQREILQQAQKSGWFLLITNASAVLSESAGGYKASELPVGTLDLTGADEHSNAVFVEVKAPGKLTNLTPEQRLTLLQHIAAGRFAVVVDSWQRLLDIWMNWLLAGKCSDYLLSQVPPKKRGPKPKPLELD